jgi:GH35 family endo-1,4-beta-xylanase
MNWLNAGINSRRKQADKVRVTFWGVTDEDFRLNSPGRVTYPLLFDRSGQPEPAFQAVLGRGKVISFVNLF